VAEAFESVGKSVTILATIIGVFISVNSLATSCSKSRSDEIAAAAKLKSENYAAFRAAATHEEQYWKSLYDDYLTVFGRDFAEPPARRAKILALYTVAQRPLPSFVEFEVPLPEKRATLTRLTAMRSGLLNSLEEQGSSDLVLRDEFARRSFVGKSAVPDDARVAVVPPPMPARAPDAADKKSAAPGRPTVQPDSAPLALPGDTVTLSPPSPSGWDIDIFWCQGSNAAANQAQALALGQGVAPLARAGRSIGPGVTLGRVRVRPVALAYQRLPGSPAIAGTWIIHDTGVGELEAATALQQIFNTQAGADKFALRQSAGAQTRWYLSAFVCTAAGDA